MSDIAIVLTGSITPAVKVAVADVEIRRRQYLDALHFYRAFAPVVFLENSCYDLDTDPDFADMADIRIVRFGMRPDLRRGKGYQEFAMLDTWQENGAPLPQRFLKITGRYVVLNVSSILEECREAAPDVILIDRYRRSRAALTSVFSITSEHYRRAFRGCYQLMDDSRGDWAERVIYKILADHPAVRSLANEPDLQGTSGSTAGILDNPRWKWRAKQALRSINRTINRREIYLRG